jgi:type I restriction enzyme S subunit
LALPPHSEQKGIAAILSSVDETIEKTEAAIGQLRVVKKTVMKELLARGLSRFGTNFTDSGAGPIPTRWTTQTIGSLAHFSGGNGFGPKDWATAGMPIIRIQNLNGSRDFNFFSGKPEATWIVEPGDLLFAWAGSRGSSFGPCLWPGPRGVLNQHIHKVQPVGAIDRNFLYYLLLSVTEKVELRAHGFKQSLVHLRKPELLGQLAAIPPEEEQREIVQLLDSIQSRTVAEEESLSRLRELKSTLLSSLLTGEIRVNPDAPTP